MFILAGGNDSAYPSYWDRLKLVIDREIASPVVLSCLFARPVADRLEGQERYDAKFHELFGENTSVLFADEEHFYEQIAGADVIYLHGGRTQLLSAAIPDVDRFNEAIVGKIVVGSSAGANFLSTVCFSPSANKTMSGSGIVGIGVIVHYGIEQFDDKRFNMRDWERVVEGVNDRANGLPVLLLPEGEFSIIRMGV